MIGAKRTAAKDQVMLVTARGQSIRFEVQDLRSASRTSGGVRGIRLDEGDSVVTLSALTEMLNCWWLADGMESERRSLSIRCKGVAVVE